MATTLYATYDGEVFRPEKPIPLEPNTRVLVTIESDGEEGRATIAEPYTVLETAKLDGPVEETGECEPHSFLRILESANLDGPPDWSERLHYYLYGEDSRSDD